MDDKSEALPGCMFAGQVALRASKGTTSRAVAKFLHQVFAAVVQEGALRLPRRPDATPSRKRQLGVFERQVIHRAGALSVVGLAVFCVADEPRCWSPLFAEAKALGPLRPLQRPLRGVCKRL